MALITCAGADVLTGRIALGLHGTWTAELKLDTPTMPTGAAVLASDGGLELHGTIVVAGVFLDSAHVRLVGGAGGLPLEVSGAFQSAQLRDPLEAIAQASGETLSPTIDSAVLSVALSYYTLGKYRSSRALDELAATAGIIMGQPIGWRVLPDGTIWMGAETWPAATLPDGADVLEVFPAEGRYMIGCDTLELLPGVALDGVGQVAAVNHWIEADRLRSWAWT